MGPGRDDRGQRPQPQPGWRRAHQGGRQRRPGEGRDEDEEAVGAGLLREPLGQRVDRQQQPGDEQDPRRDPPLAGRPRQPDGRHDRQCPRDRRQRAEAELTLTEEVDPRPAEQVVERRGVLGLLDRRPGVAERPVRDPGGVDLVEPEALLARRRQAQQEREQDQQPERDGAPRRAAEDGRHQPVPRLPGGSYRSPPAVGGAPTSASPLPPIPSRARNSSAQSGF